MVGALLLRDHPRSLAARLGAAFAFGVAAFAVNSAPGFTQQPVWWHIPIVALSTAHAVLRSLFSRSLFDDEFVLRPTHAAIWFALLLVGVVNCRFVLPMTAAPTRYVGATATFATALFATLTLIDA